MGDYHGLGKVAMLRTAASILFLLAIPLLLLSSNLRCAVNSDSLYEYGFRNFEVSEDTGLSEQELLRIGRGIIAYFNSAEQVDTDVFRERELLHLSDVKGLVQLDYYLQYAAAGYLLLFGILGYLWRRQRFWRMLARLLIWGGGATVAGLLIVGLWALIDFDSLFLLFHLASYRNELWMLSPTDFMFRMFPPEFFFRASVLVGAAVVAQALLLTGLGWGYLALVKEESPR
ncbi:DUF1461 domain-containing protein [Chloroflexota bacterium]